MKLTHSQIANGLRKETQGRLVRAIRMARKVIGILTGNKEVKLSLFISGMIQYIENSKKSTKRQTNKKMTKLIRTNI